MSKLALLQKKGRGVKKVKGRVFCKTCKHMSEMIGNGCFCGVIKERLCADNRYGKKCDYYEKSK